MSKKLVVKTFVTKHISLKKILNELIKSKLIIVDKGFNIILIIHYNFK